MATPTNPITPTKRPSKSKRIAKRRLKQTVRKTAGTPS